MKLREDAEYLASLVNDKMISLIEAKEMASLPILVVPHELLPESSEFKKFWDEWGCGKGVRKEQITVDEIDDLPFFDFVVMYNFHNNWKKVLRSKPSEEITDWNSIIYCRFTINREEDIIRKVYSCNGKLFAKTEQKYSDGIKEFDFDAAVLKVKGLPESSEHYKELRNRALSSCFGHDADAVFTAAMMWHRYHGMSDRYTVSVKQNAKPKSNNQVINQITKVLGPRIIYLDKLPSEDGEIVSESGNGNKAPHQRKGCWVTLRAERFRNHPMFQVKNGIYRKPAWVGDRTRIVHGATYTVIDKSLNYT